MDRREFGLACLGSVGSLLLPGEVEAASEDHSLQFPEEPIQFPEELYGIGAISIAEGIYIEIDGCRHESGASFWRASNREVAEAFAKRFPEQVVCYREKIHGIMHVRIMGNSEMVVEITDNLRKYIIEFVTGEWRDGLEF